MTYNVFGGTLSLTQSTNHFVLSWNADYPAQCLGTVSVTYHQQRSAAAVKTTRRGDDGTYKLLILRHVRPG